MDKKIGSYRGMPKILDAIIKELKSSGEDLSAEKIFLDASVEFYSHRGLKQKLLKVNGCGIGCVKTIFESNLESLDSQRYAERKSDADVTIQWKYKDDVFCVWHELSYEGEFSLFIEKFNSVYQDRYNVNRVDVERNVFDFTKKITFLKKLEDMQLTDIIQKIFFGAPGTGKSHKLDYDLFKDVNGNPLGKGLKSVSNDCKFRTTFHPDYDYAQFVGSYKPKKDKEDPKRIVYEFVPQVFAKAYVAAWNKFIAAGKKSTAENQVYLVIEEINRGNCAQIFGDIFQLLDRKEGHSEYPIDVDSDFANFIRAELADKFNDYKKEICSYCEDAAGESQTADDEFCKIALPPNFNILATMNTSDQSLFPMDSAFKRRFDWEYVPIDFEGKDCASYQIKIDDENSYPWQKFVESVNEKIVSITDSEDKQLGEYFIKLNPVDNNVITKERFLGKVMFYLWNEVCKDVHKQESFFREEENGNYFTFQDLYKKDGDKKLISFMNWITK